MTTNETPATDHEQTTEHSQTTTGPAPETTDTASDHEQPDAVEESTALKKARQEAAERRVAAREANERAEDLSTQLEQAHARSQLLEEALVSQQLRHQRTTLAALLASGFKASDVIGADGTVDASQLAQAVETATQKFGSLPTTPVEAARREYAEARNWSPDLLHGDSEEDWQRQIDGIKNAMVDHFPRRPEKLTQAYIEQVGLDGSASDTFYPFTPEQFLEWALEHKLYSPEAPLPPRKVTTEGHRARRGRAPHSGTGKIERLSPSTWAEVLDR